MIVTKAENISWGSPLAITLKIKQMKCFKIGLIYQLLPLLLNRIKKVQGQNRWLKVYLDVFLGKKQSPFPLPRIFFYKLYSTRQQFSNYLEPKDSRKVLLNGWCVGAKTYEVGIWKKQTLDQLKQFFYVSYILGSHIAFYSSPPPKNVAAAET